MLNGTARASMSHSSCTISACPAVRCGLSSVSASAPETRDAAEQRQRHHAAADAQVQWDVLNSLLTSSGTCSPSAGTDTGCRQLMIDTDRGNYDKL